MKTRTTTNAARLLTAAALLTPAAALVALAAGPVAAAPPPELHTFQVQCEAGDGYFAIGFGGSYRCQDTRTDGMGVFWAERRHCENAGRMFFESFQESGERGSWLCAPSSWPSSG